MAGEASLLRWLPATEAELHSALASGVLPEGHWLDMKREHGPTKAANKELAADLASFAIDGGAIILGVEEDKRTGAFAPFPIRLEQLKERIDQVARNLVDPPLSIRITEIRTEADPAVGHLVVWVPPSPDAPHAAGGKYRGRGDTTKHDLSDAEVRRVLVARQADIDIEAIIDAEIERDPFPATLGGHLFIAAQPISADPELLLDAVRETGWQEWLRRLDRQVEPSGRTTYNPDYPSFATSQANRSGAVARHSFSINAQRGADRVSGEATALDVEFQEDGGLRLYCGAASFESSVNEALTRQLHVELIDGLTERMVDCAGVICDTTGFLGQWVFGLAITGIHGLPVSRHGYSPRYPASSYRATCQVTTEELLDRPQSVRGRLLNRFHRALGLDEIGG